jgi:hypothetical protein
VWSLAAAARSDAAPEAAVAARRENHSALVACTLGRYSARLLDARAKRGKEVFVTQKDILG